jgi:Ca-activated chloride channel family protein
MSIFGLLPLKRVCLVLFSLFFISIEVVLSQDNDATECPYFNVFSSDTNGVSFALLSTNVEATISGVIANVVVEQTYLNEGDSTLDATYVFPMSSKAAIFGMQMIIDDRTLVAEIRRKAEAQEIFENANEEGLTAALLEQNRPNVFQMSIANIASGDSIKVRMVYTELLVPNSGVYQFVFPNIVGPRYTTNGEPWVYQTIIDSLSTSETSLNISLKINAGMPLNAECLSHNAIFSYSENTAITSIETSPGADFIVDFTLDGNQIETGLLLYEGETENFFLSIIQPPKPQVPVEIPKREYIFIMDVSGSMSGYPLDVSKELISNVLTNLNVNDKFNILFFAGGTSILSPNSLFATNENIDLAHEMIQNTSGGGGTNLLPAMQIALDMDFSNEYATTFVILTDGYVTVEKEAYDLIRENLNNANFFAFGIGNNVNRYIIEGIAYVGEGEPFVVTNEAEAQETADLFQEYIERPVLRNINVSFEGIESYDIEPLTIPDIFAERPIIIYGKYNSPAEGSITVSGDYGNEVYSSTLSFADYETDNEENIALKYLWARKKIRLMSDYGIASNESDTISIEEEITQLGLNYSLITEFTSFVVVDSNAVSTSSGGINPDDDDGTVIGLDSSSDQNNPVNNTIITVLGNVRSNGMLTLKLENLQKSAFRNLSLQVSSINGQVLLTKEIEQTVFDKELFISLNQLSSGVYFISLLNGSEVLDSEKFIVVD